MSGHPFWPDDIEKAASALLKDLVTREPVLAQKAEKLLDLLIGAATNFNSAVTELRTEIAAGKAIRERTFGP